MRSQILFYVYAALVASLCAALASPLSAEISIRDTSDPYEPAHDYTFEELRPRPNDIGSFRQPYFRFLILFKRKANITEEFFHRHWKTVHADLTIAQEDVGHRIQRYVQFHQDEAHRNVIKPLLDTGLMQLAPYDAIAEFHFKDYKRCKQFFDAVFADPVIVGDQNNFVDASGPLHVMAGYDNLIFGSGIKTSGGYDGILPSDPRLKFSD